MKLANPLQPIDLS
jgi:transposase InsO family protein